MQRATRSGVVSKCGAYLRQGFIRQEGDQDKDWLIVSLVYASILILLICSADSYKQNKFNLLREQSEGYSKLVAELTSNLGPAHSPVTGRPMESYASIEDRARPVWERVISLIGYFDLDPNRALDMIIDVLSVHLTTHYTFFIALLSFSPWSASFIRPLSEKDSANMTVDSTPPAGRYRGKSLDDVLALAESQPGDGRDLSKSFAANPRVLAQVLGFKFVYYQVRFGILYLCNVVLTP